MCDGDPKSQCAHPQELHGDPGECTSEQIRECHGEVAEHVCENKEPPRLQHCNSLEALAMTINRGAIMSMALWSRTGE